MDAAIYQVAGSRLPKPEGIIMSAAGKGDGRRPRDPRHCTEEQFRKNWEQAFGKRRGKTKTAKACRRQWTSGRLSGVV